MSLLCLQFDTIFEYKYHHLPGQNQNPHGAEYFELAPWQFANGPLHPAAVL